MSYKKKLTQQLYKTSDVSVGDVVIVVVMVGASLVVMVLMILVVMVRWCC